MKIYEIVGLILLLIIVCIVVIKWVGRNVVVITSAEGSIKLKGQMAFLSANSAALIFSEEGIYRIDFNVKSGILRVNHNSFNPDGATWLLPPSNGQRQYYDLGPGAHSFFMNVEKNFGEIDQISIVNLNLRQEAAFSFNYYWE